VVDNASTDDGAVLIGKNHPSVRLIVNANNRGFAAANNQALAVCRGDFILFLNPDTEVQPEALRRMMAYLENNPHIGLAGPKIVNPDGTLQESISYRYPGQKHTGDELRGLKGTIACVLGAAMIARRECLTVVGGFDEDFFLYGEDQDLCLRMRRAGKEIGYIAEAVIMHLGGQSERETPTGELWRKKTRAEYLFYCKHYCPETIDRIVRRELLKARFRIALLNITRRFPLCRQENVAKISKYRALLDEIGRRGRYETIPYKNWK
jgi:GT2 family glycosyltransferase